MMEGLLQQNPWFLKVILVLLLILMGLGLIYLTMRIIGADLGKFMEYFERERQDFLRKKMTPGALNFRCLVTVTIFGVLIIIGLGFDSLLAYISEWLGKEKATELNNSANVFSMFYALIFFSTVSVLAVIAHDRRKK